ncbi:putative cell division protein ftsW [Dinoroseobacter shibae DFL 12 = DSM 16493]|jgi:cell division protein FtsW|uniref:Probable peptidoglycan glycosyltransferase FtsW n=1 Tax=Dinoroseobacter shibae (strain DSM 16493 / NCIMB 14021 / DFL 12) TaxID=398580 RepID=A8LS65_DINSH|nr:FtsW/RodA/SpoVE family cell cycle protein [Dinoroseobacter shibae]ABV94158.1 putative cell division protein ftsW [Dinoroseobacter shibae DFL 12 = DSM 16493]URF45599.1 putative lipid II flippase FtsW [Dinoroseobacter shibae]URF49904.1 putative lipid II flippase FtsW [Dinoroseobacter shibae]
MTEMVYGTVRSGAREPVLPRWWRTVDKVSLLAILGLFAIGLLLGLAASPPLATRNGLQPFHYVERQLIFGTMALGVMGILSLGDPRMIRRMGVLLFVATFLALAFLPLFGTDFGKGATRWYSLGFASVQPSEFLKPAFIILCAWLLAAAQEINGPPGRSLSLAVALIVVAFLVIQPDFGQACLILFGWAAMYFVAGASMLLVVALVGMVGLAGVVAYNASEHFARRIDGFLSTEVDPTTQLGYATNAIREGGFFGVGVGEGQVKWVLPDAHTDFIIAVAAEEYGVLLVLVIIALYATIVLRSLWRLMKERDPFARLAGTGLVLLFAAQAIINMGVAVRMLPAKGMTLPLVSYGGSSLIATGIALGCLLAFTRSRPQGQIEDVLIKRGR